MKTFFSPASYPGRSIPVLWLALIAGLLLLSRVPLLSHMLSWDEAWNLGALRSYTGNGTLFINQLFRHPPIYMNLGLLLAPGEDGFAARMAGLSLCLTIIAILLLVAMISRFFGRRIALYTGIIYTFLPGPLFFDTWIKRDPAVSVFCIAAVWAYLERKPKWAGLLLGLGLLAKETAVFYAVSLFLIALFRCREEKWLSRTVTLFAIAIGVSWWWYLLISISSDSFLSFFTGESIEARGFHQPWWYYLEKLPLLLGWPGFILLLLGFPAMLHRGGSSSDRRASEKIRPRSLPALLLLPSLITLSLSYGKPPWITLILYPSLALFGALGWALIIRHIRQHLPTFLPQTVTASAVLVIFMALPLRNFSYSGYFQQVAPGHFAHHQTSSQLALAVSQVVAPQEKLLILPMHYRDNPTTPDPIFFWYLRPTPRITLSDDPADYHSLENLIAAQQADWLLLSPIQGTLQEKLFTRLVREQNPVGWSFERAVLLKVGEMWKSPEANAPQ